VTWDENLHMRLGKLRASSSCIAMPLFSFSSENLPGSARAREEGRCTSAVAPGAENCGHAPKVCGGRVLVQEKAVLDARLGHAARQSVCEDSLHGREGRPVDDPHGLAAGEASVWVKGSMRRTLGTVPAGYGLFSTREGVEARARADRTRTSPAQTAASIVG
jgi:hypothetical protein